MPWWKVSTEMTAAAKPSSARLGAVMVVVSICAGTTTPDRGAGPWRLLNRVQFGKCGFGGVVRRVWGLRAAGRGLLPEQERSPSPRERLFRTMVVAAENAYFVVGGVGVGRCLGADA
jgi:hypothetical protein